MSEVEIGIIGGSGLYEMGLKDISTEKVPTPFGDPSDEYIIGSLEGVRVVFLSRHGRGHKLQPSDINYRANIFGMKKLGVKSIISVSAVGSMKEEYRPGEIVIPDQFYDNTRNRISTFFGNGVVGHVPLADPICPSLADVLYESVKAIDVPVHKGGTYICIEGPQFSTRAESTIYRQWGVSVIGMTNVTEAKLAREADICYSTMAMVTDYDCWHESEEDVSVNAIIEILRQNVDAAKKAIAGAILRISTAQPGCGCKGGLKHGIMTAAENIPSKTRDDLDIIIGEFLA